ncbi:MAG: VWA domain-containing protein [Planctomycetota bacterium]
MSTPRNRLRQILPGRFRRLQRRKGTILVLSAAMMVGLLGMLALSIDTGYIYTTQSQLDRAVDAAALSGASALVDGTDATEESVVEYLIRNPVGEPDGIVAEDLDQLIVEFISEHSDDYEIELGNWNPEGLRPPESETDQRFLTLSSGKLPSAIRVQMAYNNLPTFFARALGHQSFDVKSEAIAIYQPRDIMLVLDLSGSMNDDSEFKSIGTFGKDVIMDGLETIYEELDSPEYGDVMQFEPEYITLEGVDPIHPSNPKITVEYRYESVYVTSTKDISNVVIRDYDDHHTKFDELSGYTGTFSTGQPIKKVWVKSGSNENDDGSGYGEAFDFPPDRIRSIIKTALGLDDVAYPYNSGSWNDFIDYCRHDWDNKNAGFHYQFGHANLINYWLQKKPAHDQTCDLWKVSAQPITAVKNAVDAFMEYITLVDTNDRVGLAVYNSSDGEGKVIEVDSGTGKLVPLIYDNDMEGEGFDKVVETSNRHQASHYHNYTNIGAGMEAAREILKTEQDGGAGRAGAFKMMVLLTDGRANWHDGSYSTSAAEEHAISEAYAAADHRLPVVTISLGAGADTGLMQQVADITQSRHFNIPGGQSVDEYRQELIRVFQEIADERPLQLVK